MSQEREALRALRAAWPDRYGHDIEEALDEIGWRRRNGLDEYEIVEELPRRQQERSSWWIVLLGAILVLLIVGGSQF